MKIEARPYQCPVCHDTRPVETNHIGEIYSGCKKCKNNVLYCILPEAIAARESQANGKAILRAYYLNLEKKEEREQYKNMCATLTNRGYKRWDTYGSFAESDAITKRGGEEITLYNKEQWKDQFISSVGRVFPWKEYILPNKRIKKGYYLDFLQE